MKSYISRKLPRDTRTTAPILDAGLIDVLTNDAVSQFTSFGVPASAPHFRDPLEDATASRRKPSGESISAAWRVFLLFHRRVELRGDPRPMNTKYRRRRATYLFRKPGNRSSRA